MLLRLGLLSVIVAVVFGIPAAIAGGVKEPTFEVLSSQDGVELRSYASLIRAETVVRGPYKESMNEGFRILAGYIFGGNTSSQSITMTAPVGVQAADDSGSSTGQKIAMTAPVGAEPVGDGWLVSFVMPAEFTLASLPRPLDARVTLRELPPQRVAALRFSGWVGASTLDEVNARMTTALARQGLVATGKPSIAQYNPPWTVPFMRRNELLVAVQ